jgi:hypothetical protein
MRPGAAHEAHEGVAVRHADRMSLSERAGFRRMWAPLTAPPFESLETISCRLCPPKSPQAAPDPGGRAARGRLADLIGQGPATSEMPEVSVLDEAGQMADLGFLPVVRRLLGATPPEGQRLLFSATPDGEVDVLAWRFPARPAADRGPDAGGGTSRRPGTGSAAGTSPRSGPARSAPWSPQRGPAHEARPLPRSPHRRSPTPSLCYCPATASAGQRWAEPVSRRGTAAYPEGSGER